MTSLTTQPSLTRRSLLGAGLGAVGITALAACTATAPADDVPPVPDAAGPFSRPAGADVDRPGYHLTPPSQWMNDPQRPLLLGGLWHLWYLHNADHPHGNGTEWRLATSPDLVTWRDGGTSIRKYIDALGDVESGSAVVDADGVAGLGAGVVLAFATQQADGVQRQSLYVSHDLGRTFTPAPGNPVIDNPGTAQSRDFRDPKVIRDDAHDQWVMILAEGHRLGFYTSTDLRTWAYRSDWSVDDLGTLECPDLFELELDGDPSRRTWVLVASANGQSQGRTTGVAHWTGVWDGTRFTGDGAPARWLDHGPDFYAAVTWAPDDDARPRSRWCLGWLDNWAYARSRRSGSFAGGAQSVVRHVRLVTGPGGVPRLVSTPLDALDAVTGPPVPLGGMPSHPSAVPVPFSGLHRFTRPTPSDSLRLDLDIESDAPYRLRLLDGDAASAAVTVEPADLRVAVDRVSASPATGVLGPTWTARHVGELAPQARERLRTRMSLLVDRGTLECFVDDGAVCLSAASGLGEVVAIELEADGSVLVHAATAAPIRTVQLA